MTRLACHMLLFVRHIYFCEQALRRAPAILNSPSPLVPALSLVSQSCDLHAVVRQKNGLTCALRAHSLATMAAQTACKSHCRKIQLHRLLLSPVTTVLPPFNNTTNGQNRCPTIDTAKCLLCCLGRRPFLPSLSRSTPLSRLTLSSMSR